jgi:hypothetical protein
MKNVLKNIKSVIKPQITKSTIKPMGTRKVTPTHETSSFTEWCSELNVSMMYNKQSNWFSF